LDEKLNFPWFVEEYVLHCWKFKKLPKLKEIINRMIHPLEKSKGAKDAKNLLEPFNNLLSQIVNHHSHGTINNNTE